MSARPVRSPAVRDAPPGVCVGELGVGGEWGGGGRGGGFQPQALPGDSPTTGVALRLGCASFSREKDT